jgi:FAD-linked sulfhydryl oxidase
MTSFLDNFAHFYPCTYCATHFQQHVAASPPPVQSRSLLTRFLCNYHNDVNARLGKRTFNCARYDERWRYGPAAEAPYDCVEDAGPTEADEAR